MLSNQPAARPDQAQRCRARREDRGRVAGPCGHRGTQEIVWDYFRKFWGLSDRQPSFLNGPGLGTLHPSLTLEPAIRDHHALREVRDLMDELERRVAERRAQRT